MSTSVPFSLSSLYSPFPILLFLLSPLCRALCPLTKAARDSRYSHGSERSFFLVGVQRRVNAGEDIKDHCATLQPHSLTKAPILPFRSQALFSSSHKEAWTLTCLAAACARFYEMLSNLRG